MQITLELFNFIVMESKHTNPHNMVAHNIGIANYSMQNSILIQLSSFKLIEINSKINTTDVRYV